MDDKSLIKKEDTLLDIFVSEADRKGSDLFEMSNYFDIFIDKLGCDWSSDFSWKVAEMAKDIMGRIAMALKSGFDISKIGMLIADNSHFSQEIKDGLKSGLYHIGQSKEVAGNMRPAILDEKENLVKFFTLKKAIDPTELLSNATSLSMQSSLRQVSLAIEAVGKNVKSLTEFTRRVELCNPFIYARDKIMSAASVEGVEREQYLKEADTYLLEGLGALYSDIHAQVSDLSEISPLFTNIERVDGILGYFNEDMQMIPRYVGMRVYLLNYQGKTQDAHRVLSEYAYNLRTLSERKIDGHSCSAFELIHKYYPYDKESLNFWLDEPKLMLEALESFDYILGEKSGNIYYIEAQEEDEINE